MATSEELADPKEWHVVKNWRNAQKEKERERRRIRDRLRRQTMSNEEREKHLARRRRNYQLRRQKVLNSSSFSTCQNYDSTTSAGRGGTNRVFIRVIKFTLLSIRCYKILNAYSLNPGFMSLQDTLMKKKIKQLSLFLDLGFSYLMLHFILNCINHKKNQLMNRVHCTKVHFV